MDVMKILMDMIEKSLGIAKSYLSPAFLSKNEDFLAEKLASPATGISIALILFGSIVGAIKLDSFLIFASGVGLAVSVIVCYYIGHKFLKDCVSAISNNSNTISSTSFLDVSALVAILTCVAVVIAGLYWAIKLQSLTTILTTVGVVIVLVYFSCIMLNPELISTTIDKQSTATSDALSIVTIYNKIVVRLAKIYFGSSAIIGCLIVAASVVDLLRYSSLEIYGIGMHLLAGAYLLTFGLMSPFIAYITFIFFYIIVEIIMGLTSLNKKRA